MTLAGRASMILATLATLAGLALVQAEAEGCGAQTYSWSGTVAAYGVRDFTVSVCDAEALDATASARWGGNKTLAVQLVEPDGTVHTYSGKGSASGTVSGPLTGGNWTLIMRNLTSSNVRFGASFALD